MRDDISVKFIRNSLHQVICYPKLDRKKNIWRMMEKLRNNAYHAQLKILKDKMTKIVH